MIAICLLLSLDVTVKHRRKGIGERQVDVGQLTSSEGQKGTWTATLKTPLKKFKGKKGKGKGKKGKK